MSKEQALTVAILMTGLFASSGSAIGAEPGSDGTWQLQKSGVEDDLQAVTFIDDKLGWAVGKANTIIGTTDGGKTWRRLVPRNEKGPGFSAVLFTSPKVGWVKTHIVGTILHTTDGGETWKEVPLPEPQTKGKAFSKHAAVGTTYYFQAAKTLHRTEDGTGKMWETLTRDFPSDSQRVGGMWFADADHGCASWDGGHYAMTADGGKTWRHGQLKETSTGGNFMLPQFVDAKTGWLLPQQGTIHATTDGGDSWHAQDLGRPSHGGLVGLHFADAKLGHVLLNGKNTVGEVVRTTDGGKTWTLLGSLRNPGFVEGLSFPNRHDGWVVGSKGYIEHYHEGEEK